MRIFVQGLLCISVFILLSASIASGAEVPDLLDNVVTKYLEGAKTWDVPLRNYANRLFWILATINVIFTFGYGAVSGYSLSSFFSDFLRLLITIGFFYWLWMRGPYIATTIIQSFGQMGAVAGGVSGYGNNLSPSGIVGLCWDVIIKVIEAYDDQDWGTWIPNILLSLVLAIVFAFIAVQMMMLEISAYILIYAGLWYLGLGAIAYTRDIVINYFKTVLGVAVQIMCFYLIIGLGFNAIEQMIKLSAEGQQIATKDGVVDAGINTIIGLLTILIYAIILLELLKKVPAMVAGVITGAGTGNLASAGGAYSSMMGAAAAAGTAASGVGGLAMAAAGQGMALSAAFKQAQTQMSGGGGGGESGGGGLAGIMNKGLSLAGGTMANFAKGTMSAMKEKVQSRTMGGQAADKINASMAADKAQKATESAAGQASGGGGSSGGGGDSGGSGGDSGDGNGTGADSGSGSAGSKNSGAGDSFDGGGAISGGENQGNQA